jgi:hypothetical protein
MRHIIELWHWRVTDKVSRRSFITRHPMTEAQALDFDPAAERIEGSRVQRVVRDDSPSVKHERMASPSTASQ